MKNVSVSEAQTLKKPIFCNVRLEKNAHIYIYIYLCTHTVCSKIPMNHKDQSLTFDWQFPEKLPIECKILILMIHSTFRTHCTYVKMNTQIT